MGRRLIATVAVRDPNTFGPKVFGPGDDVPEWAAALITNPTAWSSEDDSEPVPGGDEGDADDSENENHSEPTAGDVPVPPTSGKGSGRDAWGAYAKSKGVEIEADMSRDDIIAACELAEVPIA